jgi:hypothetical protein
MTLAERRTDWVKNLFGLASKLPKSFHPLGDGVLMPIPGSLSIKSVEIRMAQGAKGAFRSGKSFDLARSGASSEGQTQTPTG